MFLRRTFVCLKLMIVAGISATAWAYVVRKGDTLSKIAKTQLPGKLYGKDGSLKKIISLNPQIKNPDKIFPGQFIEIEVQKRSVASVENSIAEPVSDFTSEVPEEQLSASNGYDVDSVEASSFKRGARLDLVPEYALLVISAEDIATSSPSTLASKYYFMTKAAYIQDWSESFESSLYLKLGLVDFEPPTNSTKGLSDARKFLSGIGLGISHDLTPRWQINAHGEYSKGLFLRGASTQKNTVDSVNIASFGLKTTYNFANLDPFGLGMTASYAARLPSQTDGYDVKFGNDVGGGFYVDQLLGVRQRSKLRAELGFLYRAQNTSITTQSDLYLTLKLGMEFGVGRSQRE